MGTDHGDDGNYCMWLEKQTIWHGREEKVYCSTETGMCLRGCETRRREGMGLWGNGVAEMPEEHFGKEGATGELVGSERVE